ncbi:DNA polymerase III subunit delta' [Sneathiella glossodoripedis]|uniref:DNA polymerase III subunit delta' n=1 Tax=Sneathiella glossodoripedis TaxID=418853 RepID=UPI0004724B63|nr:DNA polymerase III subunit delta' [Sneathiella glossodoripedis]
MSELSPIDQLEGLPHPRETSELIGHQEAENLFLESYNGGRFHHAWLISGVRGVGKATFAYKAARFLLSSAASGGGLFGPPDTLDADPQDPALNLILSGAHPGLVTLKRQYDEKGKKYFKNIRVDDVRKLGNFFGMTASDGGWRVVIVDAADDMNVNAANALLKMLEEPPQKTVFLLLSHSPAALLPTIKSRCRRLSLNPLKADDNHKVIRTHFSEIEAPSVDVLSYLSEGSPGKAAALYAAGGLDAFLGVLELFDSFPEYDPDRLHGLADLAAKKDQEPLYRALCELIPWWLSRFVRHASAGIDEANLIEGEAAIMRRLQQQRPLSFWIKVWEKVNYLIERSDTVNLDRKQVILGIFLTPTLKI